MPSDANDWRNRPKRIWLGLLIATAGPGASAMAQVPGQTAVIETGDHRVVVQAAGQVDHTVLVDGRFVLRHARRNPTLGLLARGDRPDRSYRAAVGDLRI